MRRGTMLAVGLAVVAVAVGGGVAGAQQYVFTCDGMLPAQVNTWTCTGPFHYLWEGGQLMALEMESSNPTGWLELYEVSGGMNGVDVTLLPLQPITPQPNRFKLIYMTLKATGYMPVTDTEYTVRAPLTLLMVSPRTVSVPPRPLRAPSPSNAPYACTTSQLRTPPEAQ